MTIAFVFPGQGSQSVGMLNGFAHLPEVKKLMDVADNALGESLSGLIAEGPIETLSLTLNTQPAMLLASVAYREAWRKAGGPEPVALAGHSLGEYSAHTVAGSFLFEEAIRLVRYRAECMQSAVPVGVGTMAALIGLDDAAVEEICAAASEVGLVCPANKNAPGQIVIAGEVNAVERAVELAKEKGCRRALILPVSAPFHSPMMKSAGEAIRARLSEMALSEETLPVVANVDAKVHPLSDLPDVLARQAYSPVEWIECVKALVSMGVTDIVECGPGKVLTGLIRRIDPNVRLYNFSDEESLAKAIADLKAAQAQ